MRTLLRQVKVGEPPMFHRRKDTVSVWINYFAWAIALLCVAIGLQCTLCGALYYLRHCAVYKNGKPILVPAEAVVVEVSKPEPRLTKPAVAKEVSVTKQDVSNLV